MPPPGAPRLHSPCGPPISDNHLVTKNLARFAWLVLALNVGVILWGAYVRATGSGAGCGAHWPLCNGEVVPRTPDARMLVEFSHRLSSGMALAAVFALFVWARRILAPGHPARRGALASLVVILVEALLGAGLVVFGLVARDESVARAVVILLACLTVTAHWLSGGRPASVTARPRTFGVAVALLVLVMGVGMTGAVAALGDTLYPATTLADGLKADLSPASSVLLRLRVLHPALAVASAALLLLGAGALRAADAEPRGRGARRALRWLTVAQVTFGFANLAMLAPIWMQIVHLLLADLLWIALVIVSVSALSADEPSCAPSLSARGPS